VLFSRVRRNVMWFLVLTAVNGINLLHGTRIFLMIACVTFGFYLYTRRGLTWKRGIVGFGCVLALGYLVFLLRSHAIVDESSFSWLRVISPIMYEGVFSQLSLIEAVRHPELWNTWGSVHNFFLDVWYFVIPRILLPTKDKLLFIDRFTDLSPLGAFSGYAQGLIYFGLLCPIFYFVLGFVASWMVGRARRSQFWSLIYAYFVSDFLFRIMRDGYIIPVKMLVNAMMILLFVTGFGYLIQELAILRPEQRMAASPQLTNCPR